MAQLNRIDWLPNPHIVTRHVVLLSWNIVKPKYLEPLRNPHSERTNGAFIVDPDAYAFMTRQNTGHVAI